MGKMKLSKIVFVLLIIVLVMVKAGKPVRGNPRKNSRIINALRPRSHKPVKSGEKPDEVGINATNDSTILLDPTVVKFFKEFIRQVKNESKSATAKPPKRSNIVFQISKTTTNLPLYSFPYQFVTKAPSEILPKLFNPDNMLMEEDDFPETKVYFHGIDMTPFEPNLLQILGNVDSPPRIPFQPNNPEQIEKMFELIHNGRKPSTTVPPETTTQTTIPTFPPRVYKTTTPSTTTIDPMERIAEEKRQFDALWEKYERARHINYENMWGPRY